MAFREKIAWAAFVTTVLIWGSCLAMFLAFGGSSESSMMLLGLFIVATIAQAVLMTAAATIWAIRAPDEANAPADERERAIGQRATGLAYLTLVLAVMAVIVWLHLGLHGRDVIFALIGAFILGEAVRFGATAIGYRRGWHG